MYTIIRIVDVAELLRSQYHAAVARAAIAFNAAYTALRVANATVQTRLDARWTTWVQAQTFVMPCF